MNILVIGGAGYIGSHTVNILKKEGYNPVIYDNLSKGHKEAAEILGVKLINGDLGDKEKLKKVFSDEKNRYCNALCSLYRSRRICDNSCKIL
jgi:UDP-glucose 4-epimerase